MSIHSITSSLHQQYPLSLIGNASHSSSSGAASALPGAPQGASQTPPAGGLFDALMQALTQSGALTSTTAATSAAGTATTTTDATATSSVAAGASSASTTTGTSASSTQTPQQAMQAFIQNLVAALQAQNGHRQRPRNDQPLIRPDTASGAGHVHGHHGHGHGGHMNAALQDLIDQVDSTSASTPSTTSTAAATSDAPPAPRAPPP